MKFDYNPLLAFKSFFSILAFKKITLFPTTRDSKSKMHIFFNYFYDYQQFYPEVYYDSNITKGHPNPLIAGYNLCFRGFVDAVKILFLGFYSFVSNLCFSATRESEDNFGAETWGESAEYVLKAFVNLSGSFFTAGVTLVKSPLMALANIIVGDIALPAYRYIVRNLLEKEEHTGCIINSYELSNYTQEPSRISGLILNNSVGKEDEKQTESLWIFFDLNANSDLKIKNT